LLSARVPSRSKATREMGILSGEGVVWDVRLLE